jgi:hypothetical protein
MIALESAARFSVRMLEMALVALQGSACRGAWRWVLKVTGACMSVLAGAEQVCGDRQFGHVQA